MRLAACVATATATAVAAAAAVTPFDIRAYGAVPDGVTLNTAAIAAATAAASAAYAATGQPQVVEATGGGVYLSGQVLLASGVVLSVGPDTTLLASSNVSDYPSDQSLWVFVLGLGVHDSGIVGGGVVDGNQPAYVGGWDPVNEEFLVKTWPNCTGECRPRTVQYRTCVRMVLSDVTVQNSPDWTIHILNSSYVNVTRLQQYGDYHWPNNDGIDIDSSAYVSVTQSSFNTGDDAICIKSTLGCGEVHDVVVSDCTARSRSSAIKFGSATPVSMYRLSFTDITIWDSNRGLGIQQRDGGNISDVTFANITVQARQQPPNWWGSGEPIWITSLPRAAGESVGTTSNITFRNITGSGENSILISGRLGGVSGVVLQDVDVLITHTSNITRPVHDYRPTTIMLDQQPAPTDGVCVEDARGVALLNVSVTWNTTAPMVHPGLDWSWQCVNTTAAGYPVTVHGLTCRNATAHRV